MDESGAPLAGDNERREELRLIKNIAILIEVVSAPPGSTESPELVLCKALDISANGIRVRLDRELTPGSLLTLIVRYNGQDPIRLMSEVRWVRQEDTLWEVGFSLFESLQTDIDTWKHWIADIVGPQDENNPLD